MGGNLFEEMRSRHRQGAQTLPALVGTVVCLMLVLFYYSISISSGNIVVDVEDSQPVDLVAEVMVLLHDPPYAEISYSTEMIEGVQTFWKNIPNPKGILFLFHGCSHDGHNWFQLPEEVRMVRAAVRRGLIPVAFSSQNRSPQSKCWDHTYPTTMPDIVGGNRDLGLVGNAIQTMVSRENWSELPLNLLGVSSGGMIVSMIPLQLEQYFTFHSLAVYISPGIKQVYNTHIDFSIYQN